MNPHLLSAISWRDFLATSAVALLASQVPLTATEAERKILHPNSKQLFRL